MISSAGTSTLLSQVKEAKMSAVIVGGEGGASKISCRICGDTAVKHVHYGGHCCFSCKAFFRFETIEEEEEEMIQFLYSSCRRAVNWQNKNNRTFQCKFENKCEITIKNRKTCQSCRFQVINKPRPRWQFIHVTQKVKKGVLLKQTWNAKMLKFSVDLCCLSIIAISQFGTVLISLRQK